MLKAYKVRGMSMAPTLRGGDIVITVKTKPGALRSGLIYVINHSDLGCIIKRLGDKTGERYHITGDNPASTGSAIMGTVEPARITRRAILSISKSGGIKRLNKIAV